MDFTAMPAHSFFEVDDISLKEIEAHVQRDYASEDFNLDALWKSSEGEHKRKKKREQDEDDRIRLGQPRPHPFHHVTSSRCTRVV